MSKISLHPDYLMIIRFAEDYIILYKYYVIHENLIKHGRKLNHMSFGKRSVLKKKDMGKYFREKI